MNRIYDILVEASEKDPCLEDLLDNVEKKRNKAFREYLYRKKEKDLCLA